MTIFLIIKYKPRFAIFGLLQMAVFRLPLWRNRSISFWKLLGTGRNGTFDKHPDWRQWGILSVHKNVFTGDATLSDVYGPFVAAWINRFSESTDIYFLEPLQGHGSWDGKTPFIAAAPALSNKSPAAPIATLTRATIRLSKLKEFWANVPAVAEKLKGAPGFIRSYGIGEMPWLKQATFSVWESEEAMKAFAYQMRAHAEVIKKTRDRNWYKEELFFRFAVTFAGHEEH